MDTSHSSRRDRALGLSALAGLLTVLIALQAIASRRDQIAPPYRPEIARASRDATLAMASFDLRPGYEVSLWAAEPKLANPVAFWLDGRGGVYVCETFRQDDGKDGPRGVPDNRDHPEWLEDDVRAQSVEDRAAYYLKHHPDYD
ncbi:MAG: hypothetical protein KDB53_17950, partial [Planctomycetes bacterium]|nr:hypothetical protein [Planctomycetota bacterium]